MSKGTGVPRPLPHPTDDLNAQWWEHCARESLCFQRCRGCGVWRHVPRAMCARCGSPDWEWAASSGRGRIYSWTVSHRSPHPAFAPDLPFATAVVELEEGVRMIAGLRGLEIDALALDLAVEVVFVRVADGVALPHFQPRSDAAC